MSVSATSLYEAQRFNVDLKCFTSSAAYPGDAVRVVHLPLFR
jgi:hypothetical protein